MPDLAVLLAICLAVLVGGFVQSSVGLGLALVAAPVITLLAPSLMPGAILVASASLPILTLVHEGGHADWRGLGWVYVGRVAGTAGGVWLVARASPRALGVVVGVVVLSAVALTVRAVRVPVNRVSLAAAGTISGVTGTATAIGGPPVALLYQHASGPRLRATLAAFFAAGAGFSLLALAAVGELPGAQVRAGLLLVPFTMAGFAMAGALRRYLDAGRTRAAVLVVSAAGALVLLARSLTP